MTSVSVVVPAYNEGPAILPVLERLLAVTPADGEVLVVYDDPSDPTVGPVGELAERDPRVKPTLNAYGRGAARAIRTGFEESAGEFVVVSMADGSDEVELLPSLVDLVRGGAVIAVPSRYMRGGRQVGGPIVKRILSRSAGLLLYHLARVGTHDATNAFKAYRRSFVLSARVESDAGFEIALELVAKARRTRQKVVEIPTIWVDRTEGASNFKLARWLPLYLRWFFHAFGARVHESSTSRATTS